MDQRTKVFLEMGRNSEARDEILPPRGGMTGLYNLGSQDTMVTSSAPPSSLYLNTATFAMYPKSLVFALTLLSCMFLMASATPVVGAPVRKDE